MDKQFAKQCSTLNKNMTNTDSLSLTALECTNVSFVTCTSNYIISTDISCQELDIPISIPTVNIIGTTYYNDAPKSLRIYDGTHWYQIVLTQVP